MSYQNKHTGSKVSTNNKTATELNRARSKKRIPTPSTEKLLWDYRQGSFDQTMTFEEYKNKRLSKYIDKEIKLRNSRDKKIKNKSRTLLLERTKKETKKIPDDQRTKTSQKWQDYYKRNNKL
jgi:hypothetical protein